MPLYQRNGLYVAERAADFDSVDRALRDYDDRLFLSWEVERGHRLYSALYDRGDEPPAKIAEWRDERMRPLPLSSGLVELVKSLRPRSGEPDLRAAQRANDEHARRAIADFERDADEIADDMGPRISDKRSAVLHRGAHLRRARARTRYHDRWLG